MLDMELTQPTPATATLPDIPESVITVTVDWDTLEKYGFLLRYNIDL